MNGLGKPFRKKSDPKNRKNSKNQSEIAACEQKTTTEKPNFCSNTVFSLYFKIRAKKIHAAKPLAFSLHFLFRRDQNRHSNLTSKMKMCEQILKKRQRPNTIQILWIVKRQRPNTIQILWIVIRSAIIAVTWEVKECSRRKAQNVQAKNLQKKTSTFTIIAMNFVQEQLIISQYSKIHYRNVSIWWTFDFLIIPMNTSRGKIWIAYCNDRLGPYSFYCSRDLKFLSVVYFWYELNEMAPDRTTAT